MCIKLSRVYDIHTKKDYRNTSLENLSTEISMHNFVLTFILSAVVIRFLA